MGRPPHTVGGRHSEINLNLNLFRPSDPCRPIVHGFAISQKLDPLVLISIGHILGIKTKVRYNKAGFFLLDTTNSRAIENIIEYFNYSMKGMKALEYRIWARSYVKHKGDFQQLYKIRELLRNLKKSSPPQCPTT